MTLLEDIPSFPVEMRKTLERGYGIETAEAFFVHALKDAKGISSALNLTQRNLKTLVDLVKKHLSPDYIDRCRQRPVKNSRGVIVD
jgi:hypothetical protein